jgi:hypothetical protein
VIGSRRSALPACVLCVVCVAGAAGAVDATISGAFGQRFVASSEDNEVGSISDIGLTIVMRTPRTTLVMTPGFQVSAVTGSDDDGDSIKVNPRLASNLTISGVRDTLTGGLSIIPRFTGFNRTADFTPIPGEDDGEDGGIEIPPDGDDTPRESRLRSGNTMETTINASLGWTRRLNETNTLSLSTFFTQRDYADPAPSLTPFIRYGAGATWSRGLARETTGTLSLNISRFEADDEASEVSDVVTLRAGLNGRLNPRLSYNGNLGLSYRDSSRIRNGVETDTSDVSVVGDVGLNYQQGVTFYSLRLSQNVTPTSDGTLQNRATLTGSVNHSLNSRHNVSANAFLASDNPILPSSGDSGDNDDSISYGFGASHTYRPTQNWSISVGYSARADNDDSSKLEHNVFLSLNRSLSLRP